MYKGLIKDQALVNTEKYVGQHPKDHHHATSGSISGVGPFHHHKLI